jgi:hypothetical protein
VLLCIEKAVFALVSMLAVISAGATFVPMDPSNLAHRIGTG